MKAKKKRKNKSTDEMMCEKVEKNGNDRHRILKPTDLVGKFGIVEYNMNSYPGCVDDSGETVLYVECMHKVSQKNYCFYWPT